MSNARGATRIAIIVGAGVGAVAAFMGGAPRPEPAATPAPVEAPRPRAPRESAPAPASTPAPTPVVPASGARAAPSVARPETSELAQLPVAELERRCALRQAQGCLASARAFESKDAAKARLYRSLAVSLLDERCLARDAESCHDLAELYLTGSGVAKNPATASALTRRARELCAGKTTSFCEKVSASFLE